MIAQVPRFGTGVASIFEGSPIKQNNVSGKLKIASGNVQKSGENVKQTVAQENAQAARDAQEQKSFIDTKA